MCRTSCSRRESFKGGSFFVPCCLTRRGICAASHLLEAFEAPCFFNRQRLRDSLTSSSRYEAGYGAFLLSHSRCRNNDNHIRL